MTTSPPPGIAPAGRQRTVPLVLGSALLLLIGALAGLIGTSGSASAAVPGAPTGWTTVFSDDFNGSSGSALNRANWLYDLGTGYAGGAANWGTGEIESATDSTNNVYQDGQGHLVIKAIRDGSGHWTSGRIETQRTDFAAPAGGQLEMSASILQPNPQSGLGYWPAFWAMGGAARPVGATNWPSIGEYDIMEDVNALSQHSTTFHCGVWAGECHDPDGITSNLQPCGGCQTGYHTYSAIIDRTNTAAEQLRFYLDGSLTFTVNENQVSVGTWQAAIDHGFMAIFDLAIAGSYPDKVCGCSSAAQAGSITSGAAMSVDWFAVYQQNPGGSTTGGHDDRRHHRQYDGWHHHGRNHRRDHDDAGLHRRGDAGERRSGADHVHPDHTRGLRRRALPRQRRQPAERPDDQQRRHLDPERLHRHRLHPDLLVHLREERTPVRQPALHLHPVSLPGRSDRAGPVPTGR